MASDNQLRSGAAGLQPLPPEHWPEQLEAIKQDMQGQPIRVHQLMANHPDLLQAWWNFRNYSVAGGSLGKRKGELVILRVAIHMQAWYEWASHVERALACGIRMAEIEQVHRLDAHQYWPEDEAWLLLAVDELVQINRLSQQTQQQLQRHYSPQQQMDIMAIQGMYQILACMINSWGLTLDPQVAKRLPEGFIESEVVPRLG